MTTYIRHMANRDVTEWTAKTVAQAILNSGMSKHQVATETGIAYRTLDRKLHGGSDFNWRDLLAIAEVLGVNPARFTPPQFIDEAA